MCGASRMRCICPSLLGQLAARDSTELEVATTDNCPPVIPAKTGEADIISSAEPSNTDSRFVKRLTEAAVRIGVIFILAAWCFDIVRPFITAVAWAIIIATATYPAYRRLAAALGDRHGLAASLFTLLLLVVLIVPTVLLAGTLVETAQQFAADLSDGSIAVPPPPERVASWHVIGEPLYEFWSLASHNVEEALHRIGPQLRAIGSWLLSLVGTIGFGVLQFLIATIIAGVLITHADAGHRMSRAIATRLAGDRGVELAELAQETVRSVARGILGVAIIQTIIAGLGFFAVGLPSAGLLSFVCLLLAVVQIGIVPILVGVVIYVFSTADPLTAWLFTAWCVFAGVIDNILKPILLGRGVRVPMIVIFVGAIGGLFAAGIIGLFVGAVTLALAYTLFQAWLGQQVASTAVPAASDPTCAPPPA